MPIPVTPEIIPLPFAQNGQKNVIPEQGGTTTDPAASWNAGFPPITMINKQAGGKPPYGMDFNGIFNALSQHIFFSQSGCVYPWMGADEETEFAGLNYLKGSHVLGSDGEEYVALQPSGPDVPATGGGYVGPVDPVGDESGAWAKAAAVYAPLATENTPGIVKPDGMTLAVDGSGTLSASVATASQVGVVRPDGTTITVDEQGTIRGAATAPVGEVIAFAGSGTPEGYLLCNGAAVSRTTYAALFAAIGTLYGGGDGASTFNVPNLTDRFIQGNNTAGTAKNAGLPNIYGTTLDEHGLVVRNTFGGNSGPFSCVLTSSGSAFNNGSSGNYGQLTFNASNANPVYGASATVQPPALTMRYCIKY